MTIVRSVAAQRCARRAATPHRHAGRVARWLRPACAAQAPPPPPTQRADADSRPNTHQGVCAKCLGMRGAELRRCGSCRGLLCGTRRGCFHARTYQRSCRARASTRSQRVKMLWPVRQASSLLFSSPQGWGASEEGWRGVFSLPSRPRNSRVQESSDPSPAVGLATAGQCPRCGIPAPAEANPASLNTSFGFSFGACRSRWGFHRAGVAALPPLDGCWLDMLGFAWDHMKISQKAVLTSCWKQVALGKLAKKREGRNLLNLAPTLTRGRGIGWDCGWGQSINKIGSSPQPASLN